MTQVHGSQKKNAERPLVDSNVLLIDLGICYVWYKTLAPWQTSTERLQAMENSNCYNGLGKI